MVVPVFRGAYATRGLVAVATPQANPTVEAEFRRMLPDGFELVATRLTAPGRLAPRERLLAYAEQLESAINSFDTLGFDGFVFACTGCSYLTDRAGEQAEVGRLEDRTGRPVVLAVDAIEAELKRLGARRIAIISPYPQWLGDAAIAYWQSVGFEIAAYQGIDTLTEGDTRGIYTLDEGAGIQALGRFDPAGADAILLSGTGMPSLRALEAWTGPIPVLSSNRCMVDHLLRRLGIA